jgi:hypothetical protein
MRSTSAIQRGIVRALLAMTVAAHASAAMATSPQPNVPARIVPRADLSKAAAGPGILQRVAILRATAATFRRVAASLPGDAPAAEQASSRRYAAWLDARARDMDALADLGQASAATAGAKHLQEQQMSFNLQYLQLQSQMQHENRSHTAISNIMKTKHDTVKNSISNVR